MSLPDFKIYKKKKNLLQLYFCFLLYIFNSWMDISEKPGWKAWISVKIYIQSRFILRSNSHYYQTINYTFPLKLLICCLLMVSKVVVKFRYWEGLGM